MNEHGEPPSLAALRVLVAEIAVGNYRDNHGHQLVNNTAFLEAVTILELSEVLERQPTGAGSSGAGGADAA